MASVFKRKGRKAGKWLIAYADENGARRVVTGAASKTVSDQIAARLEGEVELRRRGIIDTRADRYAAAEKKPLVVKDGDGKVAGGHLADFHADILARKATKKHAGMVRSRALRVIELCKAERISDLTASAVQRAVGELRGEDETGLSLQSCNHHLRGIKQLTRWLWRDKRVREDALAHLSGFNVALDRRHTRRILSEDELAALISAADHGPVVWGMPGRDRSVLYCLAAGTGFRANECRSLTPESFKLSTQPAMVTVEAGYSKHRRRDEQPIRQDLADLLGPWLAEKPAGKPVFGLRDKPAKMLKVDLEAAGIPYRDVAGRVFDFHALRHQYISAVVRSGASVKVCQDLARHSDPKLTMNVYTHLGVHDRTAGLDALPDVTPRKPDREAARATGTDDATASPEARPATGGQRAAHAQRAGAPSCDSVRVPATIKAAVDEGRKPLRTKGKCGTAGGNEAHAPVAQLDRASVFGTEAASSQLPQTQADTESDRAARSACAAPSPKNGPEATDSDPELQRVIDAWPSLSPAVKAEILAKVEL